MNPFTTNLLRAAGEFAAVIALWLVVRSVRPAVAEVDGRHVLAYGRPFKALAIFFWLCWVVASASAPLRRRRIALSPPSWSWGSS